MSRSGFKGFAQYNTNLAAMAAAFFGADKPPFAAHLSRSDFSSKYEPTGSRYMPHQGLKERARRRAQMAKIAAKGE